tara:strand:- start:17170 stop:17958 length:789 start_codon:yes stop_codon:yes gene_type:complete
MELLIGDTSQLSYYFPPNFNRISSRNIDTTNIKEYNNIYLCFAEQRTFNKTLTEQDFIDVNVNYTSKIIDSLCDSNRNIILYGTAELWNAHNGEVNISTPINYNYTPYIKSKEILYNLFQEKQNKNEWHNVRILHPVNFNSINRKEGFLFYKIFQSIINKEKIEVGDLNIERDIIHPSYLVSETLSSTTDSLIGSGSVINVKNFIKSLYKEFNMIYDEYVKENISNISPHKNNIFWCENKKRYSNLISDTVNDIKQKQNNIS